MRDRASYTWTHCAGDVAGGVMLNAMSRGSQAFRCCVNATVSMGPDPLESLAKEKMSRFAERVFELYADKQHCTVPMRKGAYSGLINLLEKSEVPEEVVEKLDAINRVLRIEGKRQ